MAFRRDYWSCNKFADWLRGTPKITAGTADEWVEWHAAAKIKKIRYWLAEEGLDKLQDLFMWPVDRYNDVRIYLNNRFVAKLHTLTASSLKPGAWHELDTRILHCMFDELVNFVEIDLAWMTVVFSDEQREKYQLPWWRRWKLWRRWRCPEAGIEHLRWASELIYDENNFASPGDENYGKPTPQALAAQETMVLYQWWKHTRPARPDPMEASGWSAHCDESRRAGDTLFSRLSSNKTANQQQKEKEMLDHMNRLDAQYDEEDTEMLIRLVKIRKSLWT